MSETRDDAKRAYWELLEEYEAEHGRIVGRSIIWYVKAEQLRRLGNEFFDKILSIKELAVVDREAELPVTWSVTYSDPPTPSKAYEYGQSDAKADMLKAGWVKEIK